MMRILVLSNLYPPNVIGGYERLCYEVVSGLVDCGHEIVVLTSCYGGRTADYPGQRVIRKWNLLTGTDIYSPFTGTDTERCAINSRNIGILEEVLREVQPDVVFSWNLFFLNPTIIETLENGSYPIVLMLTDNWFLVMKNAEFVANFFRNHVHGSAPFRKARQGYLTNLRNHLRRLHISRKGRASTEPRMDAIFGSEFVRDFYEAGQAKFRRSVVVHNGVRPLTHKVKQPPDRSKLIDPRVLRLLFAGRLVDLKGAHTVVQAMPSLQADALGVERIMLTIVGDSSDVSYRRQLDETIHNSGCGNDVTILPPVSESDLAALFDAHDMYVFPSLYEPFSLTLIHALACGIPTIASDAGGNPEIVKDKVTGLLFGKGDAADLVRAIVSAARDARLRKRIADGGRKVGGQFTLEKMTRQMEEFLLARRDGH